MTRFLVFCNHDRAGQWYPTGVSDSTLAAAERRAAIYGERNPWHAYHVRAISDEWRGDAPAPAPTPAPAPAPALFVAATYRGCSDGWVANGPARSFSDARRLSSLIARIRPEKITRPVAA